MLHKIASEMIQEVIDGKDAEELFTGFVEGKEENLKRNPLKRRQKAGLKKRDVFLQKRGVAR